MSLDNRFHSLDLEPVHEQKPVPPPAPTPLTAPPAKTLVVPNLPYKRPSDEREAPTSHAVDESPGRPMVKVLWLGTAIVCIIVAIYVIVGIGDYSKGSSATASYGEQPSQHANETERVRVSQKCTRCSKEKPGYVKCDDCGGNGRYPASGLRCNKCWGAGWRSCPTCDGTGWAR